MFLLLWTIYMVDGTVSLSVCPYIRFGWMIGRSVGCLSGWQYTAKNVGLGEFSLMWSLDVKWNYCVYNELARLPDPIPPSPLLMARGKRRRAPLVPLLLLMMMTTTTTLMKDKTVNRQIDGEIAIFRGFIYYYVVTNQRPSSCNIHTYILILLTTDYWMLSGGLHRATWCIDIPSAPHSQSSRSCGVHPTYRCCRQIEPVASARCFGLWYCLSRLGYLLVQWLMLVNVFCCNQTFTGRASGKLI